MEAESEETSAVEEELNAKSSKKEASHKRKPCTCRQLWKELSRVKEA